MGGDILATKNRKLLIGLTFATVLIFGLITNLRSVLNPLIQSDLEISYSQLSFIVALFSAGNMISIFFSGALIARYNLKKVFIFALLIAIISLFSIQYIDTYYPLVIVMFVIGSGMGIINVAGNSLASRVFIHNRGRMLNVFHFFFGLGGILAPIYANYLFNLGFNWALVYAISSIFILLLLLGLSPQELPKEENKKKNDASFFEVLKDKRVFAFALMYFFSVGAELGLINWLGVYLNDVQHRSESEISFYLSFYFVCFTLGRLLVTLIVEKIGYLKLVIYATLLGAISLVLGIVGPDSFAFFLSLSGLFITINFPTMQAAMFEIFDNNLAMIISVTLTAGSLGDILLGNNLIGFVSDKFGINFGFTLFVIYLIVLAIITFSLDYKNKEKKHNSYK